MSSAEASGVRPVSRTRTCEYYVREDGIVVQAITTSDRLALDDARANTRLFEQLADGAKRRLLVDMPSRYVTEPDVREYGASEEANRFVAAVAMVTPSIAARLFGNLSLRFNRSPIPRRMFGSIEAAAAWLLRQPAER